MKQTAWANVFILIYLTPKIKKVAQTNKAIMTNNMVEPTTGFIVSKDGLKIGYTKFGSGPAVVIVHGSYSLQNHWFQFASLLASTNTVYVYDRRGRG